MAEIIVPNRLARSDSGQGRTSPYALIGAATTIVFALCTAALYCAGRAHRDTYFFTLGFDPDQVRTDFYDLVYWGYMTSIPIVCLYVAVGIAVGCAATFIWWTLYQGWKAGLSKWPRLRRFENRPEKESDAAPYLWPLLIALFLFPVLYVLAGSYYLILKTQDVGRERGEKLVAELVKNPENAADKHKLQRIELTFKESKSTVTSYYRLACSGGFCSVFESDSRRGPVLIAMDEISRLHVVPRNMWPDRVAGKKKT